MFNNGAEKLIFGTELIIRILQIKEGLEVVE